MGHARGGGEGSGHWEGCSTISRLAPTLAWMGHHHASLPHFHLTGHIIDFPTNLRTCFTSFGSVKDLRADLITSCKIGSYGGSVTDSAGSVWATVSSGEWALLYPPVEICQHWRRSGLASLAPDEVGTDPGYMSRKIRSFELINSIRETNGNFDSCNSCERLVPSRSAVIFPSSRNFSAMYPGPVGPAAADRLGCVQTALQCFGGER